MAVKDVKNTLGNEVEMLDRMIGCVQCVDSRAFTKQAQYIQKSWGRFLGERRDTSVSLQGLGKKDLVKDLEAELAQVNAYIDVTSKKKAGYTEHWREFLECERDILKYLLKMC
jgi:hypothetical protein